MRSPLSAVGSLRGGRYNVDVALREVQAIEEHGAPKRLLPLTIFTIECNLQRVVNLSDLSTLATLGVETHDLTKEWRAQMLDGKIPITHAIGAAAKRAGREALVYPSARMLGTFNLAVIVDALRIGSWLKIDPVDGIDAKATTSIEGRLR